MYPWTSVFLSSGHKTLNLDGSLSESVPLGSSQGRFDRSIRHNEVKTRHSFHRSEETVEATMLTTTPAVPGPSSSLLILTAKQALLLPSSLVGIYFSTCRVLLWWFVYYPLRIAWFFPAFVWARFFSLLKPRESARETREEKKNGGWGFRQLVIWICFPVGFLLLDHPTLTARLAGFWLDCEVCVWVVGF